MSPILFEAIDSKVFTVLITGSPFSLGRLAFIFIGLIGLFKNTNQNIRISNISFALVVIFFGPILGAFFSQNFYFSISRAFGNIFLLVSSFGFGYYTLKDRKIFFDVLFIANFSYWFWYIFSNMFLKSNVGLSYGDIYNNNDVLNHHIVGMHITASVVYISNRFFSEKRRVLFFLLYLIGIILVILTESRSNTICLIILFSLNLYVFSKNQNLSFIFRIIVFLFFIFFLADKFLFLDNDLERGFDIKDTEYLESTTNARRDVYKTIPGLVIGNIFGKGPIDIMVETSQGEKLLAHNLYLTFIISGGFISFFGVLLLIRFLYNRFRKVFLLKTETDGYELALVLSSLLFFFTLFTIEYLGLLFFIYVSIITNINNYFLGSPVRKPREKFYS